MRIFVTAILVLALSGIVMAADRDTMPTNPDAYYQPANWSEGLHGDGLVIEVSRLVTVYDNLADFLAVLSPTYYFDDFSWVDWGTISDPSWTFGPVNGYSYTVSAPGNVFSIPGAISTNSPLDPLTIVFDGAPVTAVGGDFFCTDFDGNPVSANTILTLDDGTVVTLAYPTVFAGFTSDVPIVSLTIATDNVDNVWVAFDNFYVGEMGTVATEAASLTSVKALFQ